MIDNHVHTLLCGHARGTMDAYIQAAIRKGLRQVCFLEHLTPLDTTHQASIAIEEIPSYFYAVQRLKQRYRSGIAVKVGLEIDFQPEFVDLYHRITRMFAFDVVGSAIHSIDGVDVVSPHTAWTDGRLAAAEIYNRYLTQLDRMVDHAYFDVVCHFDLIKKYGQAARQTDLENMKRILSKIGQNGLAVELNTSGWDHPIGEPYPAPELLAHCRRLDIPIALSSDAHQPDEVGRHFHRAAALLADAGYDRIVSYSRRQRFEVPVGTLPTHSESDADTGGIDIDHH
jgi:histidinol-phosphatase (PHP family)